MDPFQEILNTIGPLATKLADSWLQLAGEFITNNVFVGDVLAQWKATEYNPDLTFQITSRATNTNFRVWIVTGQPNNCTFYALVQPWEDVPPAIAEDTSWVPTTLTGVANGPYTFVNVKAGGWPV